MIAHTYGWRQPRLPVPYRARYGAGGHGWAPEVEVDLRPLCPPARNQGPLGACTAFALTSLVEYTVRSAVRDNVWTGPAVEPYSPLHLYYRERQMEGTLGSDLGASLLDGVASLRRFGVVPERLWQYDPARFASAPDAAAVAAERHLVVVNAEQLELDEDTIVATLHAGYPVAFGITIFESFESSAATKTGRIELPRNGEHVVGGHALLGCGVYLDGGERRVRFQNSWGAWGEDGFGSLPMSYLTNPGLCGEILCVRAVRAL